MGNQLPLACTIVSVTVVLVAYLVIRAKNMILAGQRKIREELRQMPGGDKLGSLDPELLDGE